MRATEPLNSIAVIYRMQGCFEIRDHDRASLAEVQTMLNWIHAIPEGWVGPPLAYVRGKLEGAIVAELGPEKLPAFLKSISDYLDTIFEHYVNPDYPGDASLLAPASEAARQITIRPMQRKLTPKEFCYRTQGYLELSGTAQLSTAQAEQILGWLSRLSTKQSVLYELKEKLRAAETAEARQNVAAAAMQHYFIRFIDPDYPGDPDSYHPVHRGETNPLKPHG